MENESWDMENESQDMEIESCDMENEPWDMLDIFDKIMVLSIFWMVLSRVSGEKKERDTI